MEPAAARPRCGDRQLLLELVVGERRSRNRITVKFLRALGAFLVL